MASSCSACAWILLWCYSKNTNINKQTCNYWNYCCFCIFAQFFWVITEKIKITWPCAICPSATSLTSTMQKMLLRWLVRLLSTVYLSPTMTNTLTNY
jgi:hypothetical protein